MKNPEFREHHNEPESLSFAVGEYVVFNTELENSIQLGSYNVNIAKELASKYGIGPFKIKSVRQQTPEQAQFLGHPQSLILEIPDRISLPCSGYWVKKYKP